jgi:hypothetical protein
MTKKFCHVCSCDFAISSGWQTAFQLTVFLQFHDIYSVVILKFSSLQACLLVHLVYYSQMALHVTSDWRGNTG